MKLYEAAIHIEELWNQLTPEDKGFLKNPRGYASETVTRKLLSLKLIKRVVGGFQLTADGEQVLKLSNERDNLF